MLFSLSFSILPIRESFRILKFFFHQKLTFYQKPFNSLLLGISQVSPSEMQPNVSRKYKCTYFKNSYFLNLCRYNMQKIIEILNLIWWIRKNNMIFLRNKKTSNFSNLMFLHSCSSMQRVYDRRSHKLGLCNNPQTPKWRRKWIMTRYHGSYLFLRWENFSDL